MLTEERMPVETAKSRIAKDIRLQPSLAENSGVYIAFASDQHAEAVAELYKKAYQRNDYFADRFSEPDKQIFDAEWLKREFKSPKDLRFVFMDEQSKLFGTTAFVYDQDSNSGPLFTSDETQIAPEGRGRRIMDHFFKRIVPSIEASGAGLITDFVLTPESKGLRLSLIKDLGMVATGIHPHALRHRESGVLKSEISAVKYPDLEPQPATILPEYESLYRIVQSQLPKLMEPRVLDFGKRHSDGTHEKTTREVTKIVSATKPIEQQKALSEGWRPVEFNPDRNSFVVAKYPGRRPDLNFVEREGIQADTSLVRYLNNRLFRQNVELQENLNKKRS